MAEDDRCRAFFAEWKVTMTEQEKIADYWAHWLIDAVGVATQNRALLRGDLAEDEVLTAIGVGPLFSRDAAGGGGA